MPLPFDRVLGLRVLLNAKIRGFASIRRGNGTCRFIGSAQPTAVQVAKLSLIVLPSPGTASILPIIALQLATLALGPAKSTAASLVRWEVLRGAEVNLLLLSRRPILIILFTPLRIPSEFLRLIIFDPRVIFAAGAAMETLCIVLGAHVVFSSLNAGGPDDDRVLLVRHAVFFFILLLGILRRQPDHAFAALHTRRVDRLILHSEFVICIRKFILIALLWWPGEAAGSSCWASTSCPIVGDSFVVGITNIHRTHSVPRPVLIGEELLSIRTRHVLSILVEIFWNGRPAWSSRAHATDGTLIISIILKKSRELRRIGLLLRLQLVIKRLRRQTGHRHILHIIGIVKSPLTASSTIIRADAPRNLGRIGLVGYAWWSPAAWHWVLHIVRRRTRVHTAARHVVIHHLIVHILTHPLAVGHLHRWRHTADISRIKVISLLGSLHLVMHPVLRGAQMLLHFGARMRSVGRAFRHVHIPTAMHGLVRLRNASVRAEIDALIQHRGLVKLPRWPSRIHTIHAVLAGIKPARLILALHKHLGGLHQSWPKT